MERSHGEWHPGQEVEYTSLAAEQNEEEQGPVPQQDSQEGKVITIESLAKAKDPMEDWVEDVSDEQPPTAEAA